MANSIQFSDTYISILNNEGTPKIIPVTESVVVDYSKGKDPTNRINNIDTSSVNTVYTKVDIAFNTEYNSSATLWITRKNANGVNIETISRAVSIPSGQWVGSYSIYIPTANKLDIYFTVDSGFRITQLKVYSVSYYSQPGDTEKKTVIIGGPSAYPGQTIIGNVNKNDNRGGYIEIGKNGTRICGATSASWFYTSDIRDKTDIQPITMANDFISKLKPVSFRMNERDKYFVDGKFDDKMYKLATKADNKKLSGFIAQDVYTALLETYNDQNYARVVDKIDYDEIILVDKYTLVYESIIPFLISANNENYKKLKQILDSIEGDLNG